jgi:hypothetical protein
MQKIKMVRGVTLTFEGGCNKYLENCRQRNLREGTIEHYRQSYVQFYKFFDPKMPIDDIDEQTYKDYVLHLKATLDNNTSINSYLRDLIRLRRGAFHMLPKQKGGYGIRPYKIINEKVGHIINVFPLMMCPFFILSTNIFANAIKS